MQDTQVLNSSIDEIMTIVNSKETIVLAGHTNPDGDAIGSVLAFARCLEESGKKVYVLLEDYNEAYKLIPGTDLIYKGNYNSLTPDVFVALDCGDKHRLGDAEAVFERAETTVNIDHHISNPGYAQYNYIQSKYSSTCEVVFEFITRYFIVDQQIATALYAGLVFDTGGFKHSCTKSNTLMMAAKLLEWNVPFTDILNEMLYFHSPSEARAFPKALSTMKIHDKFPIAYGYITKAMLKEVGATSKDLGGVVDYFINTRGIDVALFAYEKKDGISKVSLRSKLLNVNAIAAIYGGGGHVKASGCTIDKNPIDAVNLFLEETIKAMELENNE